uniref:HDC14665 n=1 Tax=Drosophila melanogaster TaxID=7227 RepID=Q6IJL1_DROME|nr:TPA_inf: HDC14665 [Drosophila melanogaster]
MNGLSCRLVPGFWTPAMLLLLQTTVEVCVGLHWRWPGQGVVVTLVRRAGGPRSLELTKAVTAAVSVAAADAHLIPAQECDQRTHVANEHHFHIYTYNYTTPIPFFSSNPIPSIRTDPAVAVNFNYALDVDGWIRAALRPPTARKSN